MDEKKDIMVEYKKYHKKKKFYKKLIEIKSCRKGWIVVELLSVNKGGTVTIKTIDGHVIKRKMDHIRWAPSKRLTKEGGEKPTAKIPCMTKKTLRRKKRLQKKNSRKQQRTKTNEL